MSQNFHNVHVHAATQRKRKRDAVVKAVLGYAKEAGFERVRSATDADRVIRLGGRAPWFSIADDGYDATAVAVAISKATELPVLEAYCEASAIVSLGFYANGRRAGEWAEPGKKGPPAKLVAPILAKGTPRELAAMWDQGIRQVFPETALALAAQQLGIGVPQLFGETSLRGVTIALRRKTATWTPKYQTGAPAFYVGWGSSQRYGPRDLVFEGDVNHHRVHVASRGGPGRGFAIELAGSALAGGFLEIVSCSHATLQLVRDANTWRDSTAKVPAGLVDPPDIWSMSRREADRARKLESELDWYIDVEYRALKEGECELASTVSSGGASETGTLELQVMWKPWRPSVALDLVDNHQLFAMHRGDHVIANIALRGSLAEAWGWARPYVERWGAARGDVQLHIMRKREVLVHEHGLAAGEVPYDRVAEHFGDASTTFEAAGASWLFGTESFPPFELDPREQLAIQLVLFAYNPQTPNDRLLVELEAICNAAMEEGVAHSALVYQHQYRPDATTSFEEIAVRDSDPIRIAAWHETHVRGVDKRLWLSSAQVGRLDRAMLPDHVTVTPVGRGLRLEMSDERRRAELEPVIAALGSLVPTQAEAERWTAARAIQLRRRD
ncbi:MAG: hypothetical protein ABJE66_35495 [Deltaproteobacteria bacterium]